MIIREATIFDHTGILKCISEWFGESSIDYPSPTKKIANWVNGVITQGYCVVAEIEGQIVGTSGMSFVKFPWNDEVWIMNNEWLHVSKEYRKGGTAKKLMKMAMDFAKERKLPVTMGIINGVDTEKKKRFVQMLGWQHMGGNFIYGMGEK